VISLSLLLSKNFGLSPDLVQSLAKLTWLKSTEFA